MNVYRRIISHVRPHAGIILLAGIFLTGESSVSLAVPKLLGKFIDSGALTKSVGSLWWVLLVLGGAFFLRYGFSIGHTYILGTAAARFTRSIRGDIYERLMSAELAFHTGQSVGELISRLINDVQILRRIVRSDLASLMTGFLMLAGGTALLIHTDWQLAVWFFAAVPPVVLLVRLLGKRLRSVARDVQKMFGEMTALASEHLHTIHTVKAFGQEGECVEAVCDRLDGLLDVSLRWAFLQALFQPAMGLLSFAMFGALAWAGIWALDIGRLSPGTLLTFLMYAGLVGASATKLAGLYGNVQEVLGASERVMEILDSPIESSDVGSLPLPEDFRGEVEIKDLRFSYVKDVPVLRGVTLHVPAGQTVALVGPSGVGKSTIINLLLRFYEPGAGSILIDGIDLQKINRQELRRSIGYVPQNPVLFQGTIRSNLLFGVGAASQAAIEEAAREAFIHEFIEGLPDGYDTYVGEGGLTLSVGQRQRIALARMILKNPRLMLLDEPTSALDGQSEGFIREILRSRLNGCTILLVTNKPSMVQIADQVFVLQNGRIEAKETPEAFFALHKGQIVWS